MSVKVSSWVWHERPEWVKGNTLVALLTLADIADDRGNCVFVSEDEASQSALAAKAGMSVAQFRNVTKKLEEAEVLAISRETQHSVNRYRINLTANFQRSDLAVTPPEVSGLSASPQRSDRQSSAVTPLIDVLNVNDVGAPARGTRIPATWKPNENLIEQMRVEAPSVDLKVETANFVDWSLAAPGQKGVKRNWDAAWRGWMRRTHQRNVDNGWKPTTTLPVSAEDARRDAWLAERGIMLEEYLERKDEPGWIESLKVRHHG